MPWPRSCVMRAWIVLLLLPLAGCLGSNTDTTVEAADAYGDVRGTVEREFDYSLFLGITGTEGPLDWAAYEDDLRAHGGQGERFADAFDQDVQNGAFGDGRLGAWVTTHFAYDEDRRLLGGLFTQVAADGAKKALFAPFTGPYAGTPAFATAEGRAMAPSLVDFRVAQQQSEAVLCALITTTEDWRVSSSAAAKAALATQTMQEHMERFPGGELTYYYFPKLAVEDGCPATLETPSNYWTVLHTDLDQYLDPSQPIPTVARIRIDAENGKVVAAEVVPLAIRAPQLVDELLEITDPLLPRGYVTHTVDVEVKQGATLLDLQAYRRAKPAHMLDEKTALRAPDGRIMQSTDFSQALHQYVVEDPDEGTWRFEYTYRSASPQGQHLVELHGAVIYS